MSNTLNQEEVERKRAAMSSAGWVFAVQNLPGAYVPGPNIRSRNVASHWAVSRSAIRELVSQFSQDPELLAMFQSDDE